MADYTGSSRVKVACQNCLLLDKNGWTFITFPPPHQSLGVSYYGKGVTLGKVALSPPPSLEGLTAEGSLLIALPASEGISPSLKGHLDGTSPCPSQYLIL